VSKKRKLIFTKSFLKDAHISYFIWKQETVTAMQLASFVVSIYAVPLIMSGEKLIDSQDKIE
jgi:hypothetical protein